MMNEGVRMRSILSKLDASPTGKVQVLPSNSQPHFATSYFRNRSSYLGFKAKDVRHNAFRNKNSKGHLIDLVLVAEMPWSNQDLDEEEVEKIKLPHEKPGERINLTKRRGKFQMQKAIDFLLNCGYFVEQDMFATEKAAIEALLALKQRLLVLGFSDNHINDQLHRMNFEYAMQRKCGFELERVESCTGLDAGLRDIDKLHDTQTELLFTLIHATDDVIRMKAQDLSWYVEVQPDLVKDMKKRDLPADDVVPNPEWPYQPRTYSHLDNFAPFADDLTHRMRKKMQSIARYLYLPPRIVGIDLISPRKTKTVLNEVDPHSPTTTPPTTRTTTPTTPKPLTPTPAPTTTTKPSFRANSDLPPGRSKSYVELPDIEAPTYVVQPETTAKYSAVYSQNQKAFGKDDVYAFRLDTESPRTVLPPSDIGFFTWDCLSGMALDETGHSANIAEEDLQLHGIRHLLSSNKVYEDAFCLHDGFNPKHKNYQGSRVAGQRNTLDVVFANRILDPVQMDQFRDYAGFKWAMYFLFLEEYISSLTVPSVLGVVTFLFGVAAYYDYGTNEGYSERKRDECKLANCGLLNATRNNHTTLETCPPHNFIDKTSYTSEQLYAASKWCLCGLAPNSPRVCLTDACDSQHAADLFNNPVTITLALTMAVWSIVFLQKWARTKKMYTFRWNINYLTKDVRQNPIFKGTSKTPNRLTGGVNDGVKPWWSLTKTMISWAAMIFAVLCICGVYCCVIILQNFYEIALLKDYPEYQTQISMAAIVISAMVTLVLILTLKTFFEYIAYTVTVWENHRRVDDFREAYTLKVFALNFVNTNFILFYVAVIKPVFNGTYRRPGEEGSNLFVYFPEPCDSSGCALETTIQLAILIFVKPILQNIPEFWPHLAPASIFGKLAERIESLVTPCRRWMSSKHDREDRQTCVSLIKKRLVHHPYARAHLEWLPWEEDYFDLEPQAAQDVAEDFTELVVQFGFLTMFISTFSLGPIIALFVNILEHYIDAIKITRKVRRSIPWHVSGLDAWDDIFSFHLYIGVFTQAIVLAWTWPVLEELAVLGMRGELLGDNLGDPNFLFEDSQKNVSILEMVHTFDYRDGWFCSFESTIEDRLPVTGGMLDKDIPTRFTGFDREYRFIFLFTFIALSYGAKKLCAVVIPSEPTSVRRHNQLNTYVSDRILKGDNWAQMKKSGRLPPTASERRRAHALSNASQGSWYKDHSDVTIDHSSGEIRIESEVGVGVTTTLFGTPTAVNNDDGTDGVCDGVGVVGDGVVGDGGVGDGGVGDVGVVGNGGVGDVGNGNVGVDDGVGDGGVVGDVGDGVVGDVDGVGVEKVTTDTSVITTRAPTQAQGYLSDTDTANVNVSLLKTRFLAESAATPPVAVAVVETTLASATTPRTSTSTSTSTLASATRTSTNTSTLFTSAHTSTSTSTSARSESTRSRTGTLLEKPLKPPTHSLGATKRHRTATVYEPPSTSSRSSRKGSKTSVLSGDTDDDDTTNNNNTHNNNTHNTDNNEAEKEKLLNAGVGDVDGAQARSRSATTTEQEQEEAFRRLNRKSTSGLNVEKQYVRRVSLV